MMLRPQQPPSGNPAGGAVATPERDKVLNPRDAFPLAKLETLLRDCEEQPAWRVEADTCCAYVDGKQLTAEQALWCRQNKIEPRVTNLIGRTINGVLGQEAKSRRDPHIEPDGDEWADVSDVMSVKLKEAQRESCADMAISNAYKSQVAAGIGWVEVSRVADPLEYEYRVQDIHRNEIWWDWRAKKIDLSDARWLCRRRWVDLDEAIAQFPEFEAQLKASLNNWASVIADDWRDNESMSTAFSNDRNFRISRNEWADGARKRIKFYEVWYRVPGVAVMMKLGPRWVQYDQTNRGHVEAVARGLVQVEKRPTSLVRMALYAGPYRIIDTATTKRRFPYIPFFAFRDDADNTPYGLVQGMIDPQDEYNERRLRIQWMLKAQQLLIDNDALDPKYNNIEDIVDTMMRPDMVAVMNPHRKNKDGLIFRNDLQLQKEQFDVMQDAKGLIQDVPGVYSAQLGNAPAGVTSGVAITSLIEQGVVALGELNDNYVFGRAKAYEALLDLIAEDHMAPNLAVCIGSGQTRRTVYLNTVKPKTTPDGQYIVDRATGQPAMEPANVVKDMKLHTGLAEAPSSPAYLLQLSQTIGALIQALAGTPQANALIPTWVEVTTAFGPGRKQLADDMRRMSGLPVAGDRQGQQAWQAQQQEQQAQAAALQQQQAQAQTQALTAKAAHDEANADLDRASADFTRARTAQTHVDTVHAFRAGPPPRLAAPDGSPAPVARPADDASNDEDSAIADVLRRAAG